MKQIKIAIDDYISMLETLKEGGVENILIFEQDGLPALADADDPEGTVVIFSPEGEDEDLH